MRTAEGAHLRAELDGTARAARRAVRARRRGRAGRRRRAARAAGASASRSCRPTPSVDEAAVAQEIVRFANRSDITEETVRFRAHLEHWRALSDSPEPCGRKLDFLLQEMNREVNTLGSKAEGTGVSEIVVVAQGRAREDAGAGAECRVSSGPAGCCSSCPPRRGREKPPSSSDWSRFSRIWACPGPTPPARCVTGRRTGWIIISLPANASRR